MQVVEWFKKQYDDIKGNLKFNIITWLVAGSGLTWLAHFLQSAFRANVAGWLALAAPIFSILAVTYLVLLSPKTSTFSSTQPKKGLQASPSLAGASLPVDLRGEIEELYFLALTGMAPRKTFVAMKVRIVNRGPDEATITHVGLQVLLNDFRETGEVTEIQDSWRIRRSRHQLFGPAYDVTTVAPKLQANEVYKKGLPIRGWLAFEFLLFEDVEFPNAEFDLCLTDSFGRDHHIRREPMLYKKIGELVQVS